MATCNLIFWSLIVPITLFGSELWVLQEQDMQDIDCFQRQIGRRIQRFHPWSPTHTSIRGLGWMRLETVIYAKKVLFLRTILCMDDQLIYKKLLVKRLDDFLNNPGVACENKAFSPIFDILRVTMMFGMLGMAINMVNGTHFFSKQCLKRDVWKNAWFIDNEE